MRRQLPRLLLLGALMSPATLYALGLGEIRLNSALNQPFDADIEVIAPTKDELADLKVTLASNELFARYGIDRPAYLSNFDFAVSRGRDGQVKIKVTSNRSVTEPFVTFLVEANWGRGRLLREYTVLLDPPVFMPSQPESQRPVTAPQSGARTEGRIERAPAPQPTESVPAPATQPSSPSSAPAAVIGGSYEVQRNDTLSKIARRINPEATPSGINQTMIALFRANPEAFVGNINVLKAGSVLRVPELSDIEAISRTEAAAEVAQQQQAWSGAFRGASEDTGNQLKLVTPADEPVATATPATPSAASEPAPSASTPSAGSATSTQDKRLEVTSPGLANVQQGVGEAPAAAQPEANEPSSEAPIESDTTDAEVAPDASEPAAEPAAPKARPQPVQQAPEPSLMDRIGDFWWVPVVVGLLLVIFLILTFLKRRRESESSVELDAFSPSFEPRVSPALATAGRQRVEVDDFSLPAEDLEPAFEEDVIEAAPVAAARSESKTRPGASVSISEPKTADDTLSSETSVRFDQQDALAEADFHMAYGLYDQAADLVKIAIDREPDRRDLKLKLLEIYFVWGNRELFLDTARDLHATRDEAAPGEWDKVLIMGRQIAPEDQIFKGEAGTARVDLVDVNLEGGENRVDVDLFAEPQSEAEGGLDLEFGSGEHVAPAQEASSSSDLDFLLDEPSGEEEPTREMDHLARTQETPTIESPALDRNAQTVREKLDEHAFSAAGKNGTDQTAELSLDDLGLDVDAFETTGALEHTAALEKDIPADDFEVSRPLADDEMTQLAPSLGSLDRTMEAPRIGSMDKTLESPRLSSTDKTMESPRVEKFDIESTGTIYIDQVDLTGNDTVQQQRVEDIDATASMKITQEDLDVDFDNLGEKGSGDTVRHTRNEDDVFSNDVFADRTNEYPRVDLDVGEALNADDHSPTNKQVVNEMELSELEPVTMSEVGTKLDLARAYMDMGDPDGARSILEEVLQEGTSNQKQEAQRLLDSIR